MYNDTLRKITSLSLLTILLTSTAAFALPNALPQAHAASNPNLFVSAENSQWNNYFAGPQVIQVVVADPDINRLDQAYGEPIVTVNGKRLRMAQATDGNWYAYFADRNQAEKAGHTNSVDGKGLNFGFFCGPDSTNLPGVLPGLDYAETKGFTIARYDTGAGVPFASTTGNATVVGTNPGACNFAGIGGFAPTKFEEHVVRESKQINTNLNGFDQAATFTKLWPVIQLYDFATLPTSVVVDYQKAGGDQVVTLTFDRIPSNLITTSIDRSVYPKNSQVFVTMNDPQLNIDPTEEDSWTWGANTTNSTLFYQAFDRNGVADADGVVSPTATVGPAMQTLIGNLTGFNFNHNGKLTINPKASGITIINFTDNGKQILTPIKGDPSAVRTLSIGTNSEPITFIEQGGVNTGVFGNWDGSKQANIMTLDSNVIRGQSATLRYNDISKSIVGGFSWGSISETAVNNTWASGQRIPISVTDNDANKNSKLTEHLNLYDPNANRITTMKIGTPFTIGGSGASLLGFSGSGLTLAALNPGVSNGQFKMTSGLGHDNATSTDSAQDEGTSFRPVFNFTNSTVPAAPVTIGNGTVLVFDTGNTAQNLFNTINDPTTGASATKFKGFDFFNYDLRSFTSLNGATGADILRVNAYLVNTTAATIINGDGSLTQSGKGVPTFTSIANDTSLQAFLNLNGSQTKIGGEADATHLQVLNNIFSIKKTDHVGIAFVFKTSGFVTPSVNGEPVVADFFSIGIKGDGFDNANRVNNGIYRWELEETGDNTGVFAGTNQYVMLNQLNIFDPNTYSTLRTITHDVKFAAIQDMLQSEARAPQATYVDLGQDGVDTLYSAQQDIPTHSGVVSFDSKTYKIADTVTITLNDFDLNVDNDLVDIYTAVANTNPAAPGAVSQDPAVDTIGITGLKNYTDGRAIGRLLDVQFGQQNARWSDAIIGGDTHHTASCFATDSNTGTTGLFGTSLSATGFSLVETGPSTGIFTGNFEMPDQFCDTALSLAPSSTVGQNFKVNYVDFRDSSGKLVEVSDNAGVRGNTGSVKLDKSVYPVPFGTIGTGGSSFFNAPASTSTKSMNGVFPLHRDTIVTANGFLNSKTVLPAGTTIVHIRVNDRDYDIDAAGTDVISASVFGGSMSGHGPVAVQITRQGNSMLLATAGGTSIQTGKILQMNTTNIADITAGQWLNVRDLGPMTEIAPDAGIFQADLPIEATDGPSGSDCPSWQFYDASNGTTGFVNNQLYRFSANAASHYCVRQGDVLTVTYNDTNDASGHPQTVTDSSTFDLRNGVLQSDKSVYIIGSDMILTLVEPDFNLDSQTAETAPLDLIEWDSHAFKNTMGQLGGEQAAFDAKPSTFVETGKDTGIFQSVIKIPKQLGATLLERGEQIHLEYTDWGPAGSKTVGSNNQDIELTIYTSNFGATVELDQKVYTWTDRVYTTVVAPDHNFDPNLIDTIGDSDENKVTVSTRGHSIKYKLVETGVDTGIFTGYVILTGDAGVKGSTQDSTGKITGGGVDGSGLNPTGTTSTCDNPCGPTDGFLGSEEQDGVSVSFEFTRDQTVTGSALIRWNIGEIKWLEASYPANGQGVLQIVDPDMNLNPKAVDKFDTNVWSDSDSGGIKLTMTETGEATGIFQGTVYFTTNFQSSGNRLHVAEGDTVTGEYKDRTLPPPYTPADQLRLTATTFIGTIVPPLERAPASNPRIVDSFGNAISGSVKAGQQIQITADLTNGQDRDQPFAYLVQIQDQNGVTVSLSWITGTLSAGQSLNPAQSWTPSSVGTYTAQIFVWQSIDNPNALSPPLTTTINVA